MRRPQMPKLRPRKAGAESGGRRARLEPPKFLADLYADMRDRRLLVPAIALLAALIAVPLLLSGSSEPATAPPVTAAVDPDDAVAVQSAVLVDDGGIRNYRQRLATLREKNPFAQKFALPPAKGGSGGGGGGGGSGGGTSTTETATSSSTTISGGSSSTTVSETSVSTETVSGGGGETTIDETTIDETTVEPKPQIRFYAGRVDVRVGELGKTRRIDDVRRLDFLPGDKAPIVAFVGLREGADKALFSVSSDVVETKGDGSCAPKKPAPCQFLTLDAGEERRFKLASGRTYRLKLLATHVVRIPDPRGGGGQGGDGDDG